MRDPRSRRARLFAVLAASAVGAAQVWASPADVVNISAPAVGAAAPEAKDIPDGDVSVATSTGALQYGYPLALPPGKMQPSLSLSYSSQAPIYGGIAAGWTLSGLPDVRQDGSRGMTGRTRGEINNQREYEHYVSNLAGGRPLVEVQEPMGPGADKTFRAQNDSSYARYERMADGQFFSWRVLTTDGTTHYFGEQARITGWEPQYAIARAPLTRSVDAFGNTVEYFWVFDHSRGSEYRLDHIDYGGNPAAGIARVATVLFQYAPPTLCGNNTPVGAQEDYKLGKKITDGASQLTQVTAVAYGPSNEILHTRVITLTYDGNTQSCSQTLHAPFRQLSSITERANGTNAVGTTAMVTLPTIEFTYGSADIGLATALDTQWPGYPGEPNTLSWG